MMPTAKIKGLPAAAIFDDDREGESTWSDTGLLLYKQRPPS
jgi:hypothetical protein